MVAVEMKTIPAIVSGTGILIGGTGLLGHDAQFLLGVVILAYSLCMFLSLAAVDSFHRLGELFDAWVAWEPETRR